MHPVVPSEDDSGEKHLSEKEDSLRRETKENIKLSLHEGQGCGIKIDLTHRYVENGFNKN